MLDYVMLDSPLTPVVGQADSRELTKRREHTRSNRRLSRGTRSAALRVAAGARERTLKSFAVCRLGTRQTPPLHQASRIQQHTTVGPAQGLHGRQKVMFPSHFIPVHHPSPAVFLLNFPCSKICLWVRVMHHVWCLQVEPDSAWIFSIYVLLAGSRYDAAVVLRHCHQSLQPIFVHYGHK